MTNETLTRYEVRRAQNGWVLRIERPAATGAEITELVYQERYDDEVECFADFLRALADEFGPTTSRYSPKRLYITVEPGDKYEDSGPVGSLSPDS
jgi:hypothetical protein